MEVDEGSPVPQDQKVYICLDVESTGLDIKNDRIIEFAAVLFQFDSKQEPVLLEQYQTLIQPNCKVPEIIQNMTQIKDSDLKQAPTFDQVSNKIQSFLRKSKFWVGHNLIKFDLPLLQHEFERYSDKLNSEGVQMFDTCQIFKEHEKRYTLRDAFQFYVPNSVNQDSKTNHRALQDSLMTMNVFAVQRQRYTLDSKIQERENKKEEKVYKFDKEGKFIWKNGKALIAFGKYKDKELQEVITKDKRGKSYFEWVLSKCEENHSSAEFKMIVENALVGRFPQPVAKK
jgi:DNA polymerase-3 subunit epsilon